MTNLTQNFDTFVFDTYALIEIIKGNKNYAKYLNSRVIINTFILAELSYWLIKDHGIEKLEIYVDKYRKYVKSTNSDLIKKSMLFRYENKKKKMSMADCISYFQAQELGIQFLTGDKEFENFKNVEFVK